MVDEIVSSEIFEGIVPDKSPAAEFGNESYIGSINSPLIAKSIDSVGDITKSNSNPSDEKSEIEIIKGEEPTLEEPTLEEPKAEEPKAEEPKAEEPKVEEPKAEKPKAEKKQPGTKKKTTKKTTTKKNKEEASDDTNL